MEMAALDTKRQNGVVKISHPMEIDIVHFMGMTLAECMKKVEDE
jgi:hypothetical protein